MSLEKHQTLVQEAHDQFGHCRVHAVFETLQSHFYWLYLYQDIVQYVKICHECQIHSTKQAAISPTLSVSTNLFAKIYIDVMDMPMSKEGYKYIVAVQDDLTQAAEGRALKQIQAVDLSKFIWEDIIS
jgi:hypothetical protein